MLTFTEFLTEGLSADKIKHLDHIEDHIFDGGHVGMSHIAGVLDDSLNFLAGVKKGSTRFTVKYDGCLHADTHVLLSDGSTESIESLINRWSFAADIFVVGVTEKDEVVGVPIADVLKAYGDKQWIRINLEEGEIILTEDHQVMTDRGWVEAKNIVEGDNIRDLNSYK